LHKFCPLNDDSFEILNKVCENDLVRVVYSGRDVKSVVDSLFFDSVDGETTSTFTNQDMTYILFVRDPRAIAYDQITELTEAVYDIETIQDTCNHWRTFLKFKKLMEAAQPEGQNGAKFLILRYEDFTNDADYQARELLNYFGLSFSDSSENSIDEKFIFAQTHNGEPRLKEHGWLTANDTNSWAFNTISNNRALTSVNWARFLRYKKVEKIQNYCSDIMELFGYKIYKNDEDYYNFRNWINEIMLDFDWNMDSSKLNVYKVYGHDQRERSKSDIDGVFASVFEDKIWGWEGVGKAVPEGLEFVENIELEVPEIEVEFQDDNLNSAFHDRQDEEHSFDRWLVEEEVPGSRSKGSTTMKRKQTKTTKSLKSQPPHPIRSFTST